MNKQFNASVLTPLINNEFNIELEDGGSPFTAKLVEVESGPLNGDKWEAFNAIFTLNDSENIALSETQYTIKHDSFGEITLFGSPNSDKELEFCCSFAKDD